MHDGGQGRTPDGAPMLPADWRVVLDPGVRRIDGRSVLVGGSPLRMLRLTDAGTRLIDRLVAGEPVPQSVSAQRLVRRLLDAGIAHPRPGTSSLTRADVTVVVPVRDRPHELAVTLATIGDAHAVVVVDDGSEGDAVAQVADEYGTTYARHERTRGPAAARNTGWREAATALVAFVDADCEPEPGWLDRLLSHFDDSQVAAVAPRVLSRIPSTLPDVLARYETAVPSLDRGPDEALVRPRSRVPFVPTATLVVRRDALAALGGFDEAMHIGEDVDFVWRLDESGWSVRYEPSVTVSHPARPTAKAWLRQRFDYGTSAAALAQRHGSAVAPLAVSPWSALAWTLAGLGAPIAGSAVAAGTTALLAPRLEGIEHPWAEAARLAGMGHLYAGLSVAGAVRRPWWPVAVAAATVSRPARASFVVAVTIPAWREWRRLRPPLDPVRWTAVRFADDLAYGAGVWCGCVRARSFAALKPDLTSWPGRRPAIDVTET
jgi:mycofactocin system glycosyltransferase